MTNPTLHLGTLFGRNQPFRLPISIVTATIAILARKGRGKTYTAAVLAEELLEAGQIPVIIDPTGAHWGLKSSSDGAKAGYPVVVFGGEHADLPLEEHAGETIARAIVEQRFPAILDLSLLRKGASHRFLAAFLETLYRLNREPVHLLADEADDYAPQRPFGDDARVLGAMEDIVRRGRIRGIGCTMITQRPAVLNKNVLTQADMLVALGMNHPKDISAIQEWVAVHGDLKQAEKMIASLPSLPIGVAWFWAPAFDDLFEQVKIRARRTFDSSATPKPGEKVAAPKKLAEIDVAKLGKEIADTAQRAKENDPKELKKEITDLRKSNSQLVGQMQQINGIVDEALGVGEGGIVFKTAVEGVQSLARRLTQIPTKAVEVKLLNNDEQKTLSELAHEFKTLNDFAPTLHSLIGGLLTATEDARRQIGKTLIPYPPRAIPPPRIIPVPHRAPALAINHPTPGELDEAQNTILDVISMIGVRGIPATRDSVARWLGIHPNGGRYGTNLAFLRSNGYLDGFILTARGMECVRAMETGFEAAKRKLDGAQTEILNALHGGNRFTRDTLAAHLGIHPNGGRYGTNLALLRTMGLIPERGEIHLTESAML